MSRLKEFKSTSYLKIEVLNEIVEGAERVVYIRKICIGNPVEQFITDSVIRIPIKKKVKEVKVKIKKPLRARNEKGQFIKNDPSTPENEAWVGGKAPSVPKIKRKRKVKSKIQNALTNLLKS